MRPRWPKLPRGSLNQILIVMEKIFSGTEEQFKNLELLMEHGDNNLPINREPEVVYYLFGSKAVSDYENRGIEAVKGSLLCDYGSFEFIEGVSHPTEFISAFDGWGSYTTITKADYKRLTDEA